MELQNGITIENLLSLLDLDSRLVAVELNLNIIPKVRYSGQTVHEGDTIEIVQFVGGG